MALPWGNNFIQQPAAANSINPTFPETSGMPLGSARIEVLWLLVDENEDGTEVKQEKWWPALLERRLEDTKDGEGRYAYQIIYDPDVSEGYPEPSIHSVTFLDNHELWDVGEEEVFPWRLAGSTWVPQPGRVVYGIHLPPCGGNGEQETVSASEWKDALSKINRLRGKTKEQDLVEAMEASGLPPTAQRDLALQIHSAADVFVEELQAVAERAKAENGGVVDMNLMNETLETIKKRLDGSQGLGGFGGGL